MDKKMWAVSTSMLVLKVLEEGDLYGYQMVRLLEERSARVFSRRREPCTRFFTAWRSRVLWRAMSSAPKMAGSGSITA